MTSTGGYGGYSSYDPYAGGYGGETSYGALKGTADLVDVTQTSVGARCPSM